MFMLTQINIIYNEKIKIKILGTYGIFHFIEKNSDMVSINLLFMLYDNKLIKQKYLPYTKNISIFDYIIIFTSDDLEECKKVISTVSDIEKYNI